MKMRTFILLGMLAAQAARAGITLSASPSPATFGSPVILTATISPSSATGKVTFYDGVTILGTATISGGTATLNVPLNVTGKRALVVRYRGDSNNPPSLSPVFSETINSVPASGFVPVNLNLGVSIQDFAIADFNGDGKADVVLATFGNFIAVVLGNGDGTFGTPIMTPGNVVGQFDSVVAADFDGDGKIDVALGNYTLHNVTVFLGHGDGTFGPPTSYATADGPMVVADFNLDGILDLAVVHSAVGLQSIAILLGKGDGTFGNPIEYSAGGIPSTVAVGDVNGDGKPDLVTVVPTADTQGSLISVLIGNGDGTFLPPKTYTLYAELGMEDFDSAILLEDFNGDGKLDLAIAPALGFGAWLCLGNGDGTFAPPVQLNAAGQDEGSGVGIAAVDVNGDQKMDIVTDSELHTFLGTGLGNELQTFYGNGDGTFQPVEILTPPLTQLLNKLVPADFNGDGRVDLMTWGYDWNSNLILKLFSGAVIPELRISMTDSGNITQSQKGATFTIVVTNVPGAAPTTGTVNVNLFLGGDMTVDSIAGTGWTCSANLCSRSDVLAPGATYPPIVITADMSLTAFSPENNVAVVTGGGSENAEANHFFTVIPLAVGCNFALSPSSFNLNENAAGTTVLVFTGTACGWLSSSNNSWITDTVSSGIGNGKIPFLVAQNTGPERTGTLTIGGQTLTVTQSAARTPTAVLRDTFGAIRLSSYPSQTLSNSGGAFASDPSEVQDFTGNTFVTARDNFNGIWANIYSPLTSTWSGWQFGGGATQGVPSIAVDPSSTAWIAARDAYNAYWLLTYSQASGFGSWTALHGVFATDPAVTACGDGSVYLIGKDTYNTLWSGHFVPGLGFQGWRFGGGVVKGKPSATCGLDNNAYIVAQDNSNATWVVSVSGSSWNEWWSGGGVTSVAPKIADFGNFTAAVVILDPGGAVWTTTYGEGPGNGWSAWVKTGGVLLDVAPAAVAGQLYFAGQSPAGDLWWWQKAGNQWTWIGNSGVAAGALSAAPR
jgi:hypothetical protein